MNPIPYFLCFAAGMAVNAMYNKRQRAAECKAYNKVYEQAQKEAIIRTTVTRKPYNPTKPYELPTQTEPEQKRPVRTVDEVFMESLYTNGHAVTNFK
jgi:hypothetical protein